MNVNLEEIKNKIPTFTSERLCEIIVSCRYLNLDEDLIIKCMEELSKRRSAGDKLDFESLIENTLNQMPKLDFSIPDLRSIMSNISSKKDFSFE